MNMRETTLESRHQLGSQIRELRVQQSLTQKQLGLMIGRDRSFISRIEHGRCSATFDTLLLISHGLGISPSDLLDGIGIPSFAENDPVSVMLNVPHRKQPEYFSTSL